MGWRGLFLAVHLLLAFSTFYSVILFILEAYCHHLPAPGQASGVERCMGAGGTATLGRSSLLLLFMKIASFADGDKTRQTNTAQAIELVFLLRT